MFPHDALYMSDDLVYRGSQIHFGIYESHFLTLLDNVVRTQPIITCLPSTIRNRFSAVDNLSPHQCVAGHLKASARLIAPFGREPLQFVCYYLFRSFVKICSNEVAHLLPCCRSCPDSFARWHYFTSRQRHPFKGLAPSWMPPVGLPHLSHHALPTPNLGNQFDALLPAR
jgi:hypothetical protein